MQTTKEEQKLIDQLAELRPDLIVVPRDPSAIMLLRGTQYGPVFEGFDNGSALDYVLEFLNTGPSAGIPNNPQWDPDPNDYLNEDRRHYVICRAVWKGCIEGFEEWQRYMVKDKTDFALRWDSPPKYDVITSPTPDYLKREKKDEQ